MCFGVFCRRAQILIIIRFLASNTVFRQWRKTGGRVFSTGKIAGRLISTQMELINSSTVTVSASIWTVIMLKKQFRCALFSSVRNKLVFRLLGIFFKFPNVRQTLWTSYVFYCNFKLNVYILFFVTNI